MKNKKKISLLVLGGFWGYVLTTIFQNVGEFVEGSVWTIWKALGGVLSILVMSYFAAKTYQEIREEV